MKHNKNVWWLDKAVWVMLLAYIIGIVFTYLEGNQDNLLNFLNTMTLMFILGILIAIAYLVAMKS
ncbi:hypothetical protein ACFL3V_04675 [Nanoarchaeota archaeon]